MIGARVRRYLVGVVVLAAASSIQAQTVETFAGGKIIDNVPALQAAVDPTEVAVGPDGAVYVVNNFTHKIMRRDPSTGMLSIIPPGATSPAFNTIFFGTTGTAYTLTADSALEQRNLSTGIATSMALLRAPGNPPCTAPWPGSAKFAVDSNGTVFFTDWEHNSICKVFGFNDVRRFAGADTAGFSGDGGPAASARFNAPTGIAIDATNNIFIFDSGNYRIRKIAAGTNIVSTIAGNGVEAYSGENVPSATSSIGYSPVLAFDGSGSLYFPEEGTRVRRIDAQTRLMTTVVGNGVSSTTSPDGGLATQTSIGGTSNMVVRPNGDIIFSDYNNLRVRLVTRSTGIITSIIGNGQEYFCGESATPRESCLYEPRYVAVDANGDVYIVDTRNRRVRKYSASTGLLTTIAGTSPSSGWDFTYTGEGGPAINAKFANDLADIALDATGNIFLAVTASRVVRIDKASGIVTTIAGTGTWGYSGDGGPATAAQLKQPVGVAVDSVGNVYVSDRFDNRVRKIAAGSGIITTVAGNGLSTGPLGDGGPATGAMLNIPRGLGFDAGGNLLIADSNNYRVRKVDKNTGIITTIVGNGDFNSSGDGGPATSAGINGVFSVARDPAGNLFIISTGKVRRIDAATGIITSVAPSLPMTTPEGFNFAAPDDLALDPNGRLYVSTNQIVARISGLPMGPADATPPVIQPNVAGNVGTNGWYVSDVQISWTVTDGESAISSSSGCDSSSVTSDTGGVTFTCTATSAGGTSTKSVSIKRDTAPPTLSFGSVTPAPAANGWYGEDVSIPFTASDAMSGVYSTSTGSPLTFDFSREGAGLTQQVMVTDMAGNIAFFTSPPVNIDRTAPVVHPSISGTLGNSDWYRSDVVVSWNVDDSASLLSSDGCATTTISQDTQGTTLTCTATSPGGTNTQSVTIKRDATPPTLTFGEALPAADAKGWRAAPVAVAFEASDATSGIASSSTPSPLPIAGTGAGITAQVTVTDVAGNSATFTSPAYNIDASPPTVTHSVTGTPGNNGWYRGDVRVTWQVSEPDSEVHTDGCDETLVSTDTTGVTYTCTASSNGGVARDSVTIRRDTAPPELSFGDVSPAPYANGFIGSVASIPFTTSDATSGVASTSGSSPLVFNEEGAGLTKQVTVSDQAGNSATFTTRQLNIDLTPPVIDLSVVGTVGNNGWYTSDVQVTWTIDDLARGSVISIGCPASTTINADTAGTTIHCDVTSNGGTTSRSVTIKRDATPPVLSFGTPSPAPNSNGWNKTNVSIPFTRSDAMSGLASTSVTSPLVLNTDGANLTGQVVVTDLAGNSATFTSVPRNIDKTAPVAEMNTPEDNATYGFYQDVVADYWCTDTLLVSCTAPVANGALINTKTAGALTFKITAKDSVYTTTHTHAYNVESTFNFDGFLAPASEAPTLNLVTRGALVPVRWRLPDGRGGYVTNPASFSSATVSSLTCGSAATVPLNDVANGAAGISFDAATQSFVYNWQTTASWTGCRKLTIKLKDNSTHELRFKFQ